MRKTKFSTFLQCFYSGDKYNILKSAVHSLGYMVKTWRRKLKLQNNVSYFICDPKCSVVWHTDVCTSIVSSAHTHTHTLFFCSANLCMRAFWCGSDICALTGFSFSNSGEKAIALKLMRISLARFSVSDVQLRETQHCWRIKKVKIMAKVQISAISGTEPTSHTPRHNVIITIVSFKIVCSLTKYSLSSRPLRLKRSIWYDWLWHLNRSSWKAAWSFWLCVKLLLNIHQREKVLRQSWRSCVWETWHLFWGCTGELRWSAVILTIHAATWWHH